MCLGAQEDQSVMIGVSKAKINVAGQGQPKHLPHCMATTMLRKAQRIGSVKTYGPKIHESIGSVHRLRSLAVSGFPNYCLKSFVRFHHNSKELMKENYTKDKGDIGLDREGLARGGTSL